MATPPATVSPAEATTTALDRFLAAIPYLVAAIVLLGIVMWEAATRVGPTTFSDELEWAQMSRAIASTGHAALLGKDVGFKSLYAYLIAPAWWLPTTTSAYTAIKYLNEVVMALTVVPVYLLARQLVSPRAAFVAAAGTLCTSAFFYAPQLLPEVLAYPAFALFAYVAVRALAGGGRRWVVAAIVLSVVAIEVRAQLAMAPAALALAAAWLWVVGPRGRRLRASWSVLDHVGAIVLLVGLFIVCNRAIGNHSGQWSNATQAFQGRIWRLGLESGSALVIGLGLLPAMAGLASLWVPERRLDPRWRAFAAFLAASIVTFGAYTGVKAAYNSAHFGTFVEERNLIYLQPLLLVGAVVYFSARRPSLRAAVVSIVFTSFLALFYGYQLNYPYAEAPGYGIATMANRAFRWTQDDIRLGLLGVAAVGAAIVLAPFRRPREPVLRGVLAVAALGVATFMLAGQITSARGANVSARNLRHGLPSTGAGLPVNWVDRAASGHGVTYLGQKEPNNPNGIWLIEFWNKSIENVWTIDGSAPGPGPTTTPDLVGPDGTLSNDPGTRYVLQDNGVQMIGRTVTQLPSSMALVGITSHPWRLKQAVYNVTDDGWITPPPNAETDTTATGTWAYFGKGEGTLTVVASRKAFNAPSAPNAQVTARIGPVALNEQRAPVVRHPIATRHFVVPNGRDRTLTFHVRAPVAVELVETPTFKLTDYGGTDPRPLGVRVGFQFTPAP